MRLVAQFDHAENKVEFQPAIVGRNSLVRMSNAKEHEGQSRLPPRYRRSSQTYVRPGSSNSCRLSYRPPSTQANRDSPGTPICRYYRRAPTQLLKELDGVEREGDKERIWISWDGPRFMVKNHE